jgi:SPP1 family phage portal protein
MVTGYISPELQIQLKLMADKAEIDTKRIGDIINGFLSSPQFKTMYEADKYYVGRHDILDATRSYYVDGAKQTDRVSANNKIPHPYLSILIDQKASKVCAEPIALSIAGGTDETNPAEISPEAREFESKLTEQLGVTFDDKMYDWIVGASKHSVEWMHFYVNTRGELKYLVCPSTEIIPVYDTQYENELIYVIRFYQYALIDAQGQSVKRFKVEWWTKTDVSYWAQDVKGTFFLDPFYLTNPAPHWMLEFGTTGNKTIESHAWGRVPFVVLQNNARGRTDLADIKPLIDAYDKVVSGWANDIDDFQEQILVVKKMQILDREINAGISELALFVKNLKELRVVPIEGDGDVKSLKADIPVEAKEKFLSLTRKAIFYFGRGVDSSPEVIGQAPSGSALWHLYSLLEMKCKDIIVKLKVSLKDFFWFVTTYINNKTGKAYDSNTIIVTFNTSQLFNKKEIIDGLLARKGFLSDQTLLGLDPDVNDVAEEMDRIAKQNAAQKLEDEARQARAIELATAQNKQKETVPQV